MKLEPILTAHMDEKSMGRVFEALVDDLHNVRTEAAARGILTSMCQISLLLGACYAGDDSRLILILRAIVRDAPSDETALLATGLISFHHREKPISYQQLRRLAKDLGLTG